MTNVDVTLVQPHTLQDLRSKLSDLSDSTHPSFQTALSQHIQSIANLNGLIAADNARFQSENGKLNDSAVRERWRVLSEQRKGAVDQLNTDHKACQQLFGERVAALRTAEQNHLVEKAMLREITKGHVNSWSLSSLARATTCLGIPHRANEIKTALEERKTKLGIKEGDVAPTVASPAEPALDSISKKVRDLAITSICFKEEAAVIYEAFRTIPAEQIKSSEWPKKFYAYLVKNSNGTKQSNAALKHPVEERLKEIETALGQPADAKAVQALKQEKAELVQRWTSIQSDESEMAKLLGYFKTHFSFTDSEEIFSFSGLGPVFTQSVNLLTLMTSHREQVVVRNASGEGAEIDQRKALYFADKAKYERLETNRKALMDGKVTPRMNAIDPAVQLYQASILSLEKDMRAAEKNMGALAKLTESCAKWQAEPADTSTLGWIVGAILGGSSPKKADAAAPALTEALAPVTPAEATQ